MGNYSLFTIIILSSRHADQPHARYNDEDEQD